IQSGCHSPLLIRGDSRLGGEGYHIGHLSGTDIALLLERDILPERRLNCGLKKSLINLTVKGVGDQRAAAELDIQLDTQDNGGQHSNCHQGYRNREPNFTTTY